MQDYLIAISLLACSAVSANDYMNYSPCFPILFIFAVSGSEPLPTAIFDSRREYYL